jgi:hypothetical protein
VKHRYRAVEHHQRFVCAVIVHCARRRKHARLVQSRAVKARTVQARAVQALAAAPAQEEHMQGVRGGEHLPAPAPEERLQGVRGGEHLPAPAPEEHM